MRIKANGSLILTLTTTYVFNRLLTEIQLDRNFIEIIDIL